MARIVVEHPETGQRLAIEEADFHKVEAHPLNRPHINYIQQAQGPALERHEPGRTGRARRSLADEGWQPVAYQDDQSRESPLPDDYTVPGGR